MDGSWEALSKLRDEGVVKAIGVGVNEWEVCQAALEVRGFDCFLLAGRYTLLEQQSLNTFLPLGENWDAAVVVGGGFNSGILATGAVDGAKYNYAPAPADTMKKVAKIEKVCGNYHLPLLAAALQFVVAHPAVASFCAGTRNVEQLAKNLEWLSYPIPGDFWAQLKLVGLLREDAPVPVGVQPTSWPTGIGAVGEEWPIMVLRNAALVRRPRLLGYCRAQDRKLFRRS